MKKLVLRIALLTVVVANLFFSLKQNPAKIKIHPL